MILTIKKEFVLETKETDQWKCWQNSLTGYYADLIGKRVSPKEAENLLDKWKIKHPRPELCAQERVRILRYTVQCSYKVEKSTLEKYISDAIKPGFRANLIGKINPEGHRCYPFFILDVQEKSVLRHE